MNYEDVNIILLEEFPEFTVDEFYLEFPYLTAHMFDKYLVESYQSGNIEIYKSALQFIEKLHLDDDRNVRELATVGYLESLLGENIPFEDFGEETKKWWIELNKFWSGEIKYIGETYNG